MSDRSRVDRLGDSEENQRRLLEAIVVMQRDFFNRGIHYGWCDATLTNLLHLTGSEMGFICELLHKSDGTPFIRSHGVSNISWNEDTRQFYEEHNRTGLDFHNFDSLWGSVFSTGKAVIVGEPDQDPRRGGYPKEDGHPPLKSFMGLPIKNSRGELVGVMGVANRRQGYDSDLVAFLEPFLASYGLLIEKSRLDEKNLSLQEELRQSERRYRSIFQNPDLAMLLIDPEGGRILETNRAAQNFYGWSQEEFSQKTIFDINLLTPDAIQGAMGAAVGRKKNVFQFRHRMANGNVRDVQVYSAPVPMERGFSLLSFVHDITEQKRAEEAFLAANEELRKLEKRSSALIDHSPVCHKIIDLDFNLRYMSANGFRMLNLEETDDRYGEPYPFDFFPKSARQRLKDGLLEVRASGEVVTFETRACDAHGKPVWLHHSIIPVLEDDDDISYLTVVSADITDSKRTEQELEESRDRLRKLTARLDQIREEERKALARELHDEVGQNLTALRMDLSRIEREIPDGMNRLTNSLDSMIALTQDSVDRLNRLSTELRSPILDMLGLEDAVESEVWNYQERWDTEIELDMDLGGIEASPDRDLAVYRILKESLANVMRHAQASRIEVKLKAAGGSLELRVLDDGVGITDDQRKGPESFGLIGMSERAGRVGGKVEVRRGEEGGTLVRAVVPIGPADGESA